MFRRVSTPSFGRLLTFSSWCDAGSHRPGNPGDGRWSVAGFQLPNACPVESGKVGESGDHVSGLTGGHVRFGLFDMDLGTGELRKSGIKLPLQSQPFKVLAILVEKPGELVTREEIRNRIWGQDK